MELAEPLPREARFADLTLVFYAREEGPYVENELGPVLAAPEVLAPSTSPLCLEPSDNMLQLGCGGLDPRDRHVRRAAPRTRARPWEGENAIHKARARSSPSCTRARRARRRSTGSSSARCSRRRASRAVGRGTSSPTASR